MVMMCDLIQRLSSERDLERHALQQRQTEAKNKHRAAEAAKGGLRAAAEEQAAREAADQAAAEAAAEAAAAAQAAAAAVEALRREAEAELPAFVASLYASDQGIGAKAVMRALAERGGWGAMATKVAAQDALQRLRGGAAEAGVAAAAKVHEAREAAAAVAEVLRREAEAELPGFVAALCGANKEVGTKAVMRALAERGGWGGVVKKAAVQDALHSLRNDVALQQLEEAKSLEDPSEALLELLREAERFFDGSRPKLTRRIAGLEAWLEERRQAAAAELAAQRRAAEDAERALRVEEEEAASLLAARAEAEALTAPVVRGTDAARAEADLMALVEGEKVASEGQADKARKKKEKRERQLQKKAGERVTADADHEAGVATAGSAALSSWSQIIHEPEPAPAAQTTDPTAEQTLPTGVEKTSKKKKKKKKKEETQPLQPPSAAFFLLQKLAGSPPCKIVEPDTSEFEPHLEPEPELETHVAQFRSPSECENVATLKSQLATLDAELVLAMDENRPFAHLRQQRAAIKARISTLSEGSSSECENVATLKSQLATLDAELLLAMDEGTPFAHLRQQRAAIKARISTLGEGSSGSSARELFAANASKMQALRTMPMKEWSAEQVLSWVELAELPPVIEDQARAYVLGDDIDGEELEALIQKSLLKTLKKAKIVQPEAMTQAMLAKRDQMLQWQAAASSSASAPALRVAFDRSADGPDLLGSGRFGDVFRCRLDGESGYAVKRVNAIKAREVTKEIEVLTRAAMTDEGGHRNVVRYFCREEDPDFVYICMELCDVETLDSRIKGMRDVDVRLDTVRQLFSGIDYLHQLDIIHRDLKPANILFKGQILKICDMGQSRILLAGSTVVETGAGGGTMGWMSPEEIEATKGGLEKYESRPGIVLYQ
jgi:hypothetical protein